VVSPETGLLSLSSYKPPQQKQNIKGTSIVSLYQTQQDSLVKMADAKTKVESFREWVVDHKLRTVGNSLPFAFPSYCFFFDFL
jgi:hypothetical protein